MKIIVCDPVDQSVVDHFESSSQFEIEECFERDPLERKIEDASFLIVRSGTTVDPDLLGQANQLIGIVRAGVGLDNIDLEACERANVNVENTPEASTNAVAELVVGHILSVYRSIPRADREIKQGNWIKSELTGGEIQGKTAGIIGYGRIGQRIGDILEAFGAEIIAYDEYINHNKIRSAGAEPQDSIDDLLPQSDIITVHVPLTDETEHLISDDELDKLRPGAVVINCARGGVVDEDALQRGLEDGDLRGAGLDTFETEPPGTSPLVVNDSVVATPHIGASTSEAQERIGQLVIEKIEQMA
ncbi:MAG: NAD(P)-dependent oxidoreductase [bacterium]